MNECTLVKPISLHTPNHQFFFGRTRDLHQGVLKNVNKTVFILRVISVLWDTLLMVASTNERFCD